MHRVRFIALVGAIIIASLAGAPARAANTPVVEAESLARTPYQSTVAVCINVTEEVCTVPFATFAATKNLVVVNVSCGVSLVHPSQIAAAELTTTTGIFPPLHYLPVQQNGSLNTQGVLLDNYAFDIQTSAVYSAGQTPEIIITANGSVAWGADSARLPVISPNRSASFARAAPSRGAATVPWIGCDRMQTTG